MCVTLQEINRANWEACIALQTSEDQKGFVAPNVYSLCESKFYDNLVPLAIYSAGSMVGFVMYGLDLDDGNYWIYRLMVDYRFQGQGFARAALRQVIQRLEASPDCKKIVIGYKPDNTAARKLYETVGFRETGDMLFGEVLAELCFHDSAKLQ